MVALAPPPSTLNEAPGSRRVVKTREQTLIRLQKLEPDHTDSDSDSDTFTHQGLDPGSRLCRSGFWVKTLGLDSEFEFWTLDPGVCRSVSVFGAAAGLAGPAAPVGPFSGRCHVAALPCCHVAVLPLRCIPAS